MGESRNLLIGDNSFESGLDNWYYAQTEERPERVRDAADGQYGMRLKGQPVFSRWYYHLIEAEKDYVLSFYAKGEKDCVLDLSCLDGWCGLGGGQVTLTGEWKRYSFPLIRQDVVRNLWMTLGASKEAMVDAFQLEEGTEPTPYVPSEPIGIYATTDAPSEMYVAEKDGELHLKVSVCNFLLSEQEHLTAEIEVKRFGDTVPLLLERYSLEFDAEQRASLNILLEAAQIEGYYPVFIRVFDEKGELIVEKEEPFAVAPALPENLDRDFFGMHSSRVNVEAFHRIGVGWVRYAAPAWSYLEPERGKLREFDSPDWHSMGIKRLTGIVGISAPPAWTTQEHGLPVKGEEVEAMAQHAIDTIHEDTDFYEMENEPDLTMANFHNLSKKEGAKIFAEMARSIGKVVHQNGGKLSFNVSGGGLDAMNYADVVMQEAAESFDGFAPHLYSWPRYVGEKKDFVSTPEEANLVTQIESSQKLLDKYHNKGELFIGEYGYALDYQAPCDSLYAGLHAAYIARSYLLAKSVPEMKRIFYFTDYYTVEDCYDYGLWRANCRPLPAASAHAVCALMTGGSTCRTHFMGPDFYVLEYVRGEKSVFALWNCNLKAECELRTIRIETEDVTARSMTGTPLAGKERILTIDIGPFPVYLETTASDSGKLLSELERELLRIQPYTIQVTRKEKQRLSITITPVEAMKSVYHDTLLICVEEETIKCDIAIEPGRDTECTVDIKKELSLKSLEVKITAASNGNEFVKKLPPLLICQRMQTKDWKNIVFEEAEHLLVLDQRTDVMPPDPGIGWQGSEDLSAKIFCGWDEKNLYLMFKVWDDVHCQPYADSNIYQGDCVQIGLDMENDGIFGGYDDDNDYEFGLALPESGPLLWCWKAPEGKEIGKSELPFCIEQKGEALEYRMALPWEYLIGKVPKTETVFGIGIAILDNDGQGVRFHLQTDSGVIGTKRPYLFSKLILND